MKRIALMFLSCVFFNASYAQFLNYNGTGPASATDYTQLIARQGKIRLNSAGWDDHLEILRGAYGAAFQPDNSSGYYGLRVQMTTGSNFYVLGGNVGVNTTNPTSLFDVNLAGSSVAFRGNSSSNITADLYIQRNSSAAGLGTASAIQLQDVGSGNQVMLQGGSAGFQVFNYNYTQGTWIERMRINQLGNVAIGTNVTNGYKLAVEGTIGAREVNVNSSGWTDYVFDDDYKLPSLETVERYIKENHHLPEVPSAADVEANGINVSEMNAVLLKKIEELTLYVIELRKQVNAQDDKIEKLESRK